VPTLDRRAQVTVAAYEEVAEHGLERLSLRAVARRLGATTGLISHHFVDRSELVHAALDHAAAVMLDRVQSLGVDADPVDMLAAVLPTDATTVEVWRFALSVRTAALFDPEVDQFDRRVRDYWERLLPERLEGSVAGDPHVATRHLWALVDGVALHALLDPRQWPPARQIAHLRAGTATLARDPIETMVAHVQES